MSNDTHVRCIWCVSPVLTTSTPVALMSYAVNSFSRNLFFRMKHFFAGSFYCYFAIFKTLHSFLLKYSQKILLFHPFHISWNYFSLEADRKESFILTLLLHSIWKRNDFLIFEAFPIPPWTAFFNQLKSLLVRLINMNLDFILVGS